MIVQGRWLAALAAVRAVEHMVLGGVFAAIVLDGLQGTGLSIEPFVRVLVSIF